MTMMEAVKVVSALREATVLEPVAAVMALYKSATISTLETATSWSRTIKVAACIRSGTAIGAAGEVAATVRHCAGMASTTAPTTASMPAASASSMATTTPTATPAYERDGAGMRGADSAV
jgi:hypothetical protein